MFFSCHFRFAALIGPDAPLILESPRATCALDVWDFYKPKHSEYASVDGKLSQACYLRSVDACWDRLQEKSNIKLDDIRYCCFHAPYNKLVQKGFSRLFKEEDTTLSYEDTLTDRAFDAALRAKSKTAYTEKVLPSTSLPTTIGNTYTASLYFGLVSALAAPLSVNDKILLFSYGSGSMATMFTLRVAKSLETLKLDAIEDRLKDRHQCSIDLFEKTLSLREERYGTAPYVPSGVPGAPSLNKGTYYLKAVDDLHRRTYDRVPLL